MQETWAQSLSWENPLEKEMAILSSILVGNIPQTEETDRPQSMGSQKVRHDLRALAQAHTGYKCVELGTMYTILLNLFLTYYSGANACL